MMATIIATRIHMHVRICVTQVASPAVQAAVRAVQFAKMDISTLIRVLQLTVRSVTPFVLHVMGIHQMTV